MKKNLTKVFLISAYVLTSFFITNNVLAQTTDVLRPNYSAPAEITTELTAETFDLLNPLIIEGTSEISDQLSSPGGVVSRLLNFLFPMAGLILFFLISWGGFEILVSSSDQKGMEAGKNRVTAAIVGFLLLFSSYWLAQLLELIFRIKIL